MSATIVVTLTRAQAAALLVDALGYDSGDPQRDIEGYDHAVEVRRAKAAHDHAIEVRRAYAQIALALEIDAHAPPPAAEPKPKRGRPPGSRTRKPPSQPSLPVAVVEGKATP